jgi:hypothetical protein
MGMTIGIREKFARHTERSPERKRERNEAQRSVDEPRSRRAKSKYVSSARHCSHCGVRIFYIDVLRGLIKKAPTCLDFGLRYSQTCARHDEEILNTPLLTTQYSSLLTCQYTRQWLTLGFKNRTKGYQIFMEESSMPESKKTKAAAAETTEWYHPSKEVIKGRPYQGL